jgi:hypothetical protein
MRRTRRFLVPFLSLVVATAIAPALASALTFRVNDSSFIDGTHAYIVGGRTDAVGGFASYTSDGGSNWRNVVLPRWLVGVSGQSASAAWAVGSFDTAAWSTADTGASWQRTGGIVPGTGTVDMSDMAWLPNGTLVAVGAHVGTVAGDLATIWTSQDGGLPGSTG